MNEAGLSCDVEMKCKTGDGLGLQCNRSLSKCETALKKLTSPFKLHLGGLARTEAWNAKEQ